MSQSCLFGPPKEQKEKKAHAKHDYPQVHTFRCYEGAGVQSELEDYSAELRELERLQPKTRGDCHTAREALGVDGCPWVRCRYNLLADVLDGTDQRYDLVEVDSQLVTGKPLSKQWTCVLDFVDAAFAAGGNEPECDSESGEWYDDVPVIPNRDLVSDEHVGEALGLSSEWVRQTVRKALLKIRPDMARADARVFKRRLPVL
jgi:hypothetical protein